MADHDARARFTAMTEGTQEDWSIISGHFRDFAAKLPERVIRIGAAALFFVAGLAMVWQGLGELLG